MTRRECPIPSEATSGTDLAPEADPVPEADFLLYGAYGYTGRLVAREAVERGLRPLLAGRDRAKLEAQAAELGAPRSAFPLEDREALETALGRVPLVLHCAGPFQHTFRPMVEACLRTGAHYLDVTGEIGVFEALAGRGERARERGVVLLPGVGFDVVPSDCLAAHLRRRLPSATRLRLAIQSRGGGLSRGTALTMAENAGRGGVVRKEGVLRRVPAAWKVREVDFGDGPRTAATIPWGDVATAYHSTGIGDIETYAAMPPSAVRALRATRYLAPLLRTRPVTRLIEAWIRRTTTGPDPEERARAEARVWGRVADGRGRSATSRLRTPESYTLTARTAVACARRVLGGDVAPGFRTPSGAFGADFILGFEGIERVDVEGPDGGGPAAPEDVDATGADAAGEPESEER